MRYIREVLTRLRAQELFWAISVALRDDPGSTEDRRRELADRLEELEQRIFGSQSKAERRTAFGESETDQVGLGRLWGNLPAELRRRPPRTRAERCLVLDLIEEALREGISLEEATRSCGVAQEAMELWKAERLQALSFLDQMESATGPLVQPPRSQSL